MASITDRAFCIAEKIFKETNSNLLYPWGMPIISHITFGIRPDYILDMIFNDISNGIKIVLEAECPYSIKFTEIIIQDDSNYGNIFSFALALKTFFKQCFIEFEKDLQMQILRCLYQKKKPTNIIDRIEKSCASVYIPEHIPLCLINLDAI